MKQLSAKDLRLGNLLQTLEGKITSVTEIITASNWKDTYFWCYNYNESQVKPIELTEELLIKAGFKHNNKHWFEIMCNGEFDYLNYNIKNEIASLTYIDDEFILSADIKYFHQLQNLYFALTNEELNIKL